MRKRLVRPGLAALRTHWVLVAVFVPLWFQLAVAFCWWALPSVPLYDYLPYKVELPSGQVVDDPPEITLRSGQKLVIARHICSTRPVDAQVDRSMTGPFYEEQPPIDRHFPRGCVERMVVIDVDTATLPAGRYWYAASVDLYLNPLRPHYYVPLQGFWIDIVGNPPPPPGSD